MVMMPCRHASEPSPKPIIVAPGVNANNGGHEMLLIHIVVSVAPIDGRRGDITSCENFHNLDISQKCDGVVAIQASLKSLSKAHHCCPRYPCH